MSSLHTKSDFQSLMHTLLDPLKPLYSAGGARLRIGATGASYNRTAIEVEAFSRPLWALGPYWAGGGRDADFAAIYQNGLANGADPASGEYWGALGDFDQCYVEMAAFACAMIEARPVVWDPLSDKAKRDLAAWLGQINTHELPHCNWLFFRVLVNLALDAVGAGGNQALLAQDLAEVDSWYAGDGWYSDGDPAVKPQRDYYIPWAIQYYGVLYSVYAADRDPERAARYRARALAFGRQFAAWFDTNGAAVPYGRSLCYRFAQSAFYAACIWAGLEPLPLPVMKGILVRNLQWWLEKPIFDRDGILTVGYCYPTLFMSEEYNAPGSPYWSMKTFRLLALPDDHPFWSAEAAPLPAEYAAPGLTLQPAAHLLLQRMANGGVNLYAPAEVEQNDHGQFTEKYGKFCYSTRFGFSASRSYAVLGQAAPDSMLAFEIGGQIFVRRHSLSFEARADRMVSTWSPFPGITVETEIVPTPTGHTRRHLIHSEIACTAWDCGFAVPRYAAGYSAAAADGAATAANAAARCTVQGDGAPEIINTWANTNLYDPNCAIPALRYEIPAGDSEWRCAVIEG